MRVATVFLLLALALAIVEAVEFKHERREDVFGGMPQKRRILQSSTDEDTGGLLSGIFGGSPSPAEENGEESSSSFSLFDFGDDDGESNKDSAEDADGIELSSGETVVYLNWGSNPEEKNSNGEDSWFWSFLSAFGIFILVVAFIAVVVAVAAGAFMVIKKQRAGKKSASASDSGAQYVLMEEDA